MKLSLRGFGVAVAGMSLWIGSPAQADGNVRCDAGPRGNWKSLSEVRKKAWMEGWKVARVQVEGDCYEVYAHTEAGLAIEAFFHPVTLRKLVVFRRGSEIYRAPGFGG